MSWFRKPLPARPFPLAPLTLKQSWRVLACPRWGRTVALILTDGKLRAERPPVVTYNHTGLAAAHAEMRYRAGERVVPRKLHLLARVAA